MGAMLTYGILLVEDNPGDADLLTERLEDTPFVTFAVLRATTVLILRNGRYAYWGSPYLDDHGEEDIDIKRGRALRLNKERFDELHRLWVQGVIEHDSRVLSCTVREQRDEWLDMMG